MGLIEGAAKEKHDLSGLFFPARVCLWQSEQLSSSSVGVLSLSSSDSRPTVAQASVPGDDKGISLTR